MKDRIRIGLNLSLPFGLFKSAGIFVIYGDFAQVSAKVQELKSLLYSTGNNAAQEFADRFVCQKS